MKRKKQTDEGMIQNTETYEMYYNRLRDYAISMFEWEGLPDSINERFLEIKLYEEGKVVFFEDPDMGMLSLPVTYGQLNVYGEPVNYKAVSIGYNRDLTIDDAVIMYANYSRKPIDYIIRQYARRLMQVERTMDVNIHAQKTPVLVLTEEESQRLTMKNMYMQYDGNEPFIFAYKKGFNPDSVTVLKTDAPFVSDKLMEYKHNLWNEAMTFLGVGNAKQDKKERLVSDEVSANDEQIEGARFIMLKARQEACKKINDMFGTNISVDFKFNKDAERVAEEGDEIEED